MKDVKDMTTDEIIKESRAFVALDPDLQVDGSYQRYRDLSKEAVKRIPSIKISNLMLILESNKEYTRNTYKWIAGEKKPSGTLNYTVIRVKNGIVDFWYISDTDNINHGQLSEELFTKDIL